MRLCQTHALCPAYRVHAVSSHLMKILCKSCSLSHIIRSREQILFSLPLDEYDPCLVPLLQFLLGLQREGAIRSLTRKASK